MFVKKNPSPIFEEERSLAQLAAAISFQNIKAIYRLWVY